MREIIKKGNKITILGAGNVGATIAYTLTVAGTCSEIVLIDINKPKAEGEAMDITQGLAFCPSMYVHSGEYEDVVDSDIVIVTLGMARKPGQTRIDLAQKNVNIIKSVMPKVAELAPDAVYIVVSNPVDILTYATIRCTNLSPKQVIGSGTVLDTSRLRSILAEKVGVNLKNIHGYVFGEHGDTSMVPWSLTTITGMGMDEYCESHCTVKDALNIDELDKIEEDVRAAGAEVISRKGATYYAIALSVRRICDAILRNSDTVLTVSTLMEGQYGINDVCFSVPAIVDAYGVQEVVEPKLQPEEEVKLKKSAAALREIIDTLEF